MRALFLALLSVLLMSACGGGGSAGPLGAEGGIGGSPDFINPLVGAFDCLVDDGGAYGYYANGERIVDGVDYPSHYAVDLSVFRVGGDVIASRGGDVVRANKHFGYGNIVIVKCNAVAGYGHVYNLYAHLDSIDPLVRAGASVDQGQRIGGAGSSGKWTTGPHLHFAFIDSPTPVVFAETPVQSSDTWKDPALHVAGLRHCEGPGFPAPPPTGQGPGPFTTTDNTSAATGQSYVFDYVMEWNASAGATHYEVFWYRLPLSDTRSFNPSTIDSSGVTPVSVFGRFNAPTRWEYTIDWAQEPYRIWERVKAFNAAGETWESGLIVLGYRGP